VAIYVDDVIIAGSKNMIFETRKQLFDNFPIKDLGEPSTWMGRNTSDKECQQDHSSAPKWLH
jgi:hypothetical protein